MIIIIIIIIIIITKIKIMFQGCMYRPTNEIKIETKNKTEIK